MTEYANRYKTPLGYLMVTWGIVYLVISWFAVYVRGEPFDTSLLLGGGLLFALVVSFVLSRNV